MKKIVFSGGGSLGHITPSMAIWEQWKQQHPDSECLFICANRADEITLLTEAKLPYRCTISPRLRWNFIYTFSVALLQNARILRGFAPDALVSKGGYISVPTCIMAWLFGIPIFLHESDTTIGRANRSIHRLATRVYYGIPRDHYRAKELYTGNPVRTAMYSGSKERGLTLTRLNSSKPILLVSGGSQGSQSINEAVWQQLPALLSHVHIIHITGRGKLPVHSSQLTADGYFITEFVTHELADLYAVANLALTRASAGTMAELQANGVPMILCPLRSVGHDHQQKNAEAIQAAGLATVIQQTELHTHLLSTVQSVLKTPLTTSPKSSNAARIIVDDVTKKIVRAN